MAALLLLALLVGGIFGWKYYQASLQSAGYIPAPTTVAAVRVELGDWRAELPAVGSLVASQRLFVTNEVGGQIQALKFSSGQPVDQGALLLQLNDSVDQAELRGLIADRRLAEIQYNRLEKLLSDRSVSRSDYDEAKARLDRGKAAVEGKRALIDKKAIRAPFAGLLGIRQVEVGEYLPPGSNIVMLESLDPMFVDFSLPERYFAELHIGQKVDISVRAWPGQLFPGEVSAISSGVDAGTRSLRIRATLENPDGRLRSGMFAEVSTALPTRTGVLSLPRTAISFNPYGSFVFVIDTADGGLTVTNRRVTTGSIQGGRIEIVDGLSAGEQVVSAGQVKLRNGQSVVVDQADPLTETSVETAPDPGSGGVEGVGAQAAE